MGLKDTKARVQIPNEMLRQEPSQEGLPSNKAPLQEPGRAFRCSWVGPSLFTDEVMEEPSHRKQPGLHSESQHRASSRTPEVRLAASAWGPTPFLSTCWSQYFWSDPCLLGVTETSPCIRHLFNPPPSQGVSVAPRAPTPDPPLAACATLHGAHPAFERFGGEILAQLRLEIG